MRTEKEFFAQVSSIGVQTCVRVSLPQEDVKCEIYALVTPDLDYRVSEIRTDSEMELVAYDNDTKIGISLQKVDFISTTHFCEFNKQLKLCQEVCRSSAFILEDLKSYTMNELSKAQNQSVNS